MHLNTNYKIDNFLLIFFGADCFLHWYDILNYFFFYFFFQDQLIPNSAWKDYSANTNYAFDAFSETEEKQKRNGRGSSVQQQTLQMSHSPAKAQYYNNGDGGRSSRHENGNGNDHHRHYQNGENGRGYQNGNEQPHIPRTSYTDRTYSLPRTVVQQQQQLQSKHQGYYTQDRRNRSAQHHPHSGGGGSGASSAGIDTPDFYFMPSQRKYSGEVVRVYVDYNKDPKN